MAKTASKTFRCEKYLADAIVKKAASLDLSLSDYICIVMTRELSKEGAFDTAPVNTIRNR